MNARLDIAAIVGEIDRLGVTERLQILLPEGKLVVQQAGKPLSDARIAEILEEHAHFSRHFSQIRAFLSLWQRVQDGRRAEVEMLEQTQMRSR